MSHTNQMFLVVLSCLGIAPAHPVGFLTPYTPVSISHYLHILKKERKKERKNPGCLQEQRVPASHFTKFCCLKCMLIFL